MVYQPMLELLDFTRKRVQDVHRVGRRHRGLDGAGARGWIVADIARDWKTIYPSNRAQR